MQMFEADAYKKLSNSLGLGAAKESVLLGLGLEAAVTELGRGVDELEGDLLGGVAAGLGQHGLAEGDHALLGTDDAALDHDEVLVDNTVVGEAAHGVDGLLGQISLGGGVVVDGAILVLEGGTDAVDLLVDLGTVMVTHLTSASHGELHAGRVPGANTGNLAQTTVGLTRQTGDAPTSDNALETVTLGDTDGVDHVVLGEDVADRDELLEEAMAEVDLLGDGATVDLDLHQVSLLLAELDLADVGVGKHTHDVAVLLDALQLGVGSITTLGLVLGQTLGVLGESLLLGVVPVV